MKFYFITLRARTTGAVRYNSPKGPEVCTRGGGELSLQEQLKWCDCSGGKVSGRVQGPGRSENEIENPV